MLWVKCTFVVVKLSYGIVNLTHEIVTLTTTKYIVVL